VSHSLRARVRCGDRAAFGELFDSAAATVYRYALRVSGDPATAEDVVSTTFLEAWKGCRRLHQEEGPLEPWLLGIATNVMRNLSRSTQRHQGAIARLGTGESEPDIAESVVADIHHRQQLVAAQAALASLGENDREVFVLCIWMGLDYRSTAQALDIPIGTVRSRLSRARTRLRALGAQEMSSTPGPDSTTGTADQKASPNLEPVAATGQIPGDRAKARRFIGRKAQR
jgi:RNA polymerase sigma factor (sigma-70 family)